MTRQFSTPISLPEVPATPTTPASGYGALYGKTDGLPYWLGDDGVERAVIPPVAPVLSLHDNPGFEGTWANTSNSTPVVIGLTPPSWNTFWCQDQVTIQQETAQKTEGSYAVRMNRPVGTNKGVRLHSAMVFGGLNPGDVVTIEVDAKSTVAGIVYVDFLTSDTQAGCDFFSGNPMTQAFNRPTTMTAGAAYRRCTGTFTVPAGCYWGRASFHYDTTGDVAGSVYLDNSSSRVTPVSSVATGLTIGARIGNSTTVLPNSATTPLLFTTTDYNNGCTVTLNDAASSHGTGSSIIVPTDGTYLVTAGFTPDLQATTGRRVASVFTGSSPATPVLLLRTEWTQAVAAAYAAMVLTGEVFLTAGTKLTATFYHNSGVVNPAVVATSPAFLTVRKTDTGPKGDPGPAGPPSSVIYPVRQVFTASGTWTKPAKFVYAEVECQGGGGGGGGVSNSTSTTADAGASGGGGGYTKKIWLDVDLSATENVVVGAGGTAGAANDAAAGAGQPSSFSAAPKTPQVGNGGGGAGAATGNAGLARASGGSGGGGSGGDYTITGGDGPSGAVIANAGGTAPSVQAVSGGASFMGGASRPAVSAAGGAGANGQTYGGGGGGGYSRAASGAFAGGAGGAGIVIVTSYVTT